LLLKVAVLLIEPMFVGKLFLHATGAATLNSRSPDFSAARYFAQIHLRLDSYAAYAK